jgi:hypothetical protein
MNRPNFMFATAALLLAIAAGCKSSPNVPAVAPVTPAPPVVSQTNQFHPPAASPALPVDSGDSMAPGILAFDATAKVYHAKPGELLAPFTFNLTNVSSNAVTIYDTSTSCDCTVASLPSKPWTLPSGGVGQINATINLSNKVGVVTNQVIIYTSQGNRRLNVKAFAPETPNQSHASRGTSPDGKGA